MCRSIKPLFNYEPPATRNDMHAAALQYVRKISGYRQPSQINEVAFNTAVDEIAAATARLLGSLQTSAPPRDRDAEILRKKELAQKRFG